MVPNQYIYIKLNGRRKKAKVLLAGASTVYHIIKGTLSPVSQVLFALLLATCLDCLPGGTCWSVVSLKGHFYLFVSQVLPSIASTVYQIIKGTLSPMCVPGDPSWSLDCLPHHPHPLLYF